MKKIVMFSFFTLSLVLFAQDDNRYLDLDFAVKKPSLSTKRRTKKVARCQKDLLQRSKLYDQEVQSVARQSLQDRLNQEVLKQLKRRYPKRIDIVKSQDTLPDAYNYSPLKNRKI